MIKLIAPTTIESVDEGNSVILEMDPDSFRALRMGVEVAFEDGDSATPLVSPETQESLWNFFVKGENQP